MKPPRQTPPSGTRSEACDDLQTQLEELLDRVWRSEAEWRLEDRIGLAVRIRPEA
ncbi:MAG: hypothetical protein M3024_04005 [Candidatus Dormibacteraeota bacterium]|nr:hypothetical protein [Candidatus Dormibacteraeota bacterium]